MTEHDFEAFAGLMAVLEEMFGKDLAPQLVEIYFRALKRFPIERVAAAVDEKTIRRDGQFAEAVDTIVDTLGPEMRQTVLAGDTKIPKRQVVKSAQAVRRLKRRLQPEDFSFMRGLPRGFSPNALRLLAQLLPDEHALVNALLDQPGVPAREMLDVTLRRLPAHSPQIRQSLYQLSASADPRHRAYALQHVAGDTPITLPALRFLARAGAGLQRAVDNVDHCLQLDPMVPWSARGQALSTQIQALRKGELAEVDDPADETINDAKDSDAPVDQGMPEFDVERESAAASNLTTSLDPVLDFVSRAPAEVERGVPPCGWCESNRTWRAEASGRIHCDHCHAVYNPATGGWEPGERGNIVPHLRSVEGSGNGASRAVRRRGGRDEFTNTMHEPGRPQLC